MAAKHAGYGIAVWLVPGGAAGERLSSVIQRLTPGLPAYHTPHTTLRCHLDSVQSARAVARAVAEAIAPFTLRVSGAVEVCNVVYAPGEAEDCCQAVHAAVAAAPEFHRALRLASAALREATFEPHVPHVSLAYRYGSPLNAEEVAELNALARGQSACSFNVDRLCIATCRGMWPDWRVLEEVPLQGEHGGGIGCFAKLTLCAGLTAAPVEEP